MRSTLAPGRMRATPSRSRHAPSTRCSTKAAAPEIDLLSLDVEGYEPEVLEGLDLHRHAPRYMLIEMLNPDRSVAELSRCSAYSTRSWRSPHLTMCSTADGRNQSPK